MKSGRSDIIDCDRSESMSCSDKILLWNMVGIQGPLLGLITKKPIYLTSIVIECENF